MGKETGMLDLNQPFEESSSSDPPLQLYDLMPDECNRDSGFNLSLKESIQQFWNEQITEISDFSDLKSQLLLPLARIKRIMKSDQEVEMVSGEAPILVAKGIKIFIMELTLRAWLNAQKDHRQILHGCDIASAIRHEAILALLLSRVVPIHDLKGEPNPNKGTELLAHRLHLQNMNAQEAAYHPKETELQPAYPNNLHSLLPDFHVTKPEYIERFFPEISSMPSNNPRGSEAFHTRKPEFVEALPSLISSQPSNHCPSSEAFNVRNPDTAKFLSSASSVPSDYRPGFE